MKMLWARGYGSHRFAGVLLGAALLLAGCGADVPQNRQADGEIQFGIWVQDEQGAIRFRATADVPNEEDQTYGWRVRVAESEQALKWIESVTLPVAPDTWEGVEDDPSVTISDDGRTATTVGIVVPDGGYLENWWYVSIGDRVLPRFCGHFR
jgi:hypothetical protein